MGTKSMQEFINRWQLDDKFRQELQKNPDKVMGEFDVPDVMKKNILNAVKQGGESLASRISAMILF